MRRRGRDLDGWLVLDKPYAMGSTQALAKVRRAFDAKKAGHGGTLDPLATGILPIAFGQATKTIPYVMDAPKTYRFTLAMGESRTTDDLEGEVLETSAHRPDDATLARFAASLTGDILQVPPIYSALKVGGQRAYDLARAGQVPDLPPRPARVDRFELIARPDADTAVFEVRSGKGVYMRALARDVARLSGTVGHVSALRRLSCGPFTEAGAITLDNLMQNVENAPTLPAPLLPIATALADIPALAVTAEEARSLMFGQVISRTALGDRLPAHQEILSIVMRATCEGRVVGLCRLQDGALHPARMFAESKMGDDDVDHC